MKAIIPPLVARVCTGALACLAALAAAITMALAVSLLAAPATALAADEVRINGDLVPNGETVTCGEGTATLSGDGGTLMLAGATIRSNEDHTLPLEVHGGELDIVLAGENRIESSGQGVHGFSADLTFRGKGILTVEAVGGAVVVDGGSVTVDECTIDIRSTGYQGLVCRSGTINIHNGADVTVESYGEAIAAHGGLSISDSTVTATSYYGSVTGVIQSNTGNVSIENSTVTATGASDLADSAIYARNVITIDRSDVIAASEGMHGIWTDSVMEIFRSTVTAEGATGIGMVVQGSLVISDSTLTATGRPDPVSSAIYTENLEILGGSDVTCCGGVHATRSLVVEADPGALVDVMVGTLQGGAGHFDHCGLTSPLSSLTDFGAFIEGGSTALDWLNGYTYLRIGEHAHAFDREVVADRYKVAEATCTDAATYRCSCVCEEAGTDTFASGDPLGHEWGEPTWSWADDYSEATATFTCQRDASHTHKLTAKVSSATTDPTATEAGGTVYTATVELDGSSYMDIQTVVIPATGTTTDGPDQGGEDGADGKGAGSQGSPETGDPLCALPFAGLLAAALAAAALRRARAVP